jgi:phage-related protein
MRDIGGYLIDGLIEGLGNGIVFVGNKMAEIGDAIKDKIEEFYDKYIAAGVTVVKKIIKGIGNKAEDLYKSVSSTVREGLNAIKNLLDVFVKKGEAIISSIVDGLTNAKDWIKDKLVGDDGLLTNALNALENLWGDFKEIGSYLIDGIIGGIKDAADDLGDKVEEVAGNIKDGICKFFGINSPSRVMMEIGGYITEGLAIGIADKGDMATAAITNVSDDVVDGLGGLSSKIADIVNADTDFNPTITPMVDLTNVATGANAINDMLSANQSLALAGSADISVNKKIDDGLSKKLDVNNTDVVNELASLRADMKEMSDAILQMSIVLDTGAMVGAMAAPMDSALGRRATLRRRGV